MSKYTLHFKYQAVLHYLHIRSQQRTADHYGISRTHLRRWIRAYQEGGIGALEHPQSKTMPQHRKNPFIADKPDQEKTQAELIEELCYMRAEVAYLKELKALSQKQTAKDKAKPSKHPNLIISVYSWVEPTLRAAGSPVWRERAALRFVRI